MAGKTFNEMTEEERVAKIDEMSTALEIMKSEKEKLQSEVSGLKELKDRHAREIGELRTQVNKQTQKTSRSFTGDIDTDYSPDKDLELINKNPRSYVSSVVEDQISELRNTINYQTVIKTYPEYENPKFRDKVINRQEMERNRGFEITTIDAIERVKLEEEKEELKKEKEAFSKSVGILEAEKRGVTGFTGGTPSGGVTNPEEKDTTWERIVGSGRSDKAPF